MSKMNRFRETRNRQFFLMSLFLKIHLNLILTEIFLTYMWFSLFQTEIAKRLNAIIAQILPFLSQEHQQQVATAVERAKQVTMTELNAIIGVSIADNYLN